MKKYAGCLAGVLCLALVAGAQISNQSTDVPVAPLAAVEFNGWTNSFRLANDVLQVVVVSEIGRIASISLSGSPNILRADDWFRGQFPNPPGGDWKNFGGDWLWPVTQSRWAQFAGKDWPPPSFVADAPWEGTAWKTAE